MVVCKFFLQGNCRFGDNCKFDHPRNQNQYDNSYQQQNQYQSNRYDNSNKQYNQYQSNRYDNSYQQQNQYQSNRYHNNDQQTGFNRYDSRKTQGSSTNLFSQLVSGADTKTSPSKPIDPEHLNNDQEFLDYITNDFKTWLNSSSWKLSCYKYNKKAKNLPILQDISEEEVRYALFEAKKNNRYNEELQQFSMKHNQVMETIREIADPNQQTKEYLLKYFHESEQSKAQFPSQSVPTAQKVNPFAQIIEKKQQELQNQQTQQQPTNLFQTTTSPVQNFLQQQQPNQIQTSNSFLFTNQAQSPKPVNPFTQMATERQQSPINNQTGLFNAPSQIIGGQAFPATTNQSAFNMTTQHPNSFNNIQNNVETPDINPNPKVFSNTSELSEQDLKQFKESKFTLGLIPQCPPTKQLCLL